MKAPRLKISGLMRWLAFLRAQERYAAGRGKIQARPWDVQELERRAGREGGGIWGGEVHSERLLGWLMAFGASFGSRSMGGCLSKGLGCHTNQVSCAWF